LRQLFKDNSKEEKLNDTIVYNILNKIKTESPQLNNLTKKELLDYAKHNNETLNEQFCTNLNIEFFEYNYAEYKSQIDSQSHLGVEEIKEANYSENIQQITEEEIQKYSTTNIIKIDDTNLENFQSYTNDDKTTKWKTLKDGIFTGTDHGDRHLILYYNDHLRLFNFFKDYEIKLNDITDEKFDLIKKNNFNNIVVGNNIDDVVFGNVNKLARNAIYGEFIYLLEHGDLKKYNFIVTFVRGDGFCSWYGILAVLGRIENINSNVLNIHENFKNDYENFLKNFVELFTIITSKIDILEEIGQEIGQYNIIKLEPIQEHFNLILNQLVNNPRDLNYTIIKFIATYYKVNVYILKINGRLTNEKITLQNKFKDVFAINNLESYLEIEKDRNILLIHTGTHYTPVMTNENRFWLDLEINDIKDILMSEDRYFK